MCCREEQKTARQESSVLISELKTSLQRARSGGTETTDGYASDVNSLCQYSETSRESSPAAAPAPAKQSYTVPLTLETEAGQQLYSSVIKRPHPAPPPASPAPPRQRAENGWERPRPGLTVTPRPRAGSESEAELSGLAGRGLGSCTSLESAGHLQLGSRPITPGFPPATPAPAPHTATLPPKSPLVSAGRGASRLDLTTRAPSPAGSVYQAQEAGLASRRGSLSSEPTEVSASHVKLVKDRNRFWYKPAISREEAISVLRAQPPGSFIVRDSNSFPGAFGLALKVATAPQHTAGRAASDPHSELVRHFLIEPTSKGVKLKGYSNEPVFASLSALIYQHTVTPLALPGRLVLPQYDLGPGPELAGDSGSAAAAMAQLLQLGAACSVFYLFSMDTDQLTGPAAVRKTVSQLFLTRPLPAATVVHFKVSGQGITLTDQARKLFFRKHHATQQISHCGLDPEDRRWSVKDSAPEAAVSNRLFAFVSRKPQNRACNQCHVFAELDADQPARAIVNFVNKVMVAGAGAGAGAGQARGGDMV